MRNMGIVRGSIESAIPFEVNVDTVYLRFNIEPVPATPDDENESFGPIGEQYQYHEIQYGLQELLQVITEAVIDTGSFALKDDLLKELEAQSSAAAGAFAEQTYIGLPEQKPFTFNTRFTQRRT